MKSPFEISWAGGAAEKHFRKLRPDVRDLPWGTLDPKRYPARLVERARAMWTSTALNEYATAVRFGQAIQAMLLAKAPLDLVGMAGDIVTDEACHAELASRVVAELGGAAPLAVDYDTLSLTVDPTLTPLQRASDLLLRLCCVSEAFAAHMAVGLVRSPAHPLIHGVYDVIARDESRHGRIGGLYMEWACDDMDDAERARLARVALDMLRGFTRYWRRPPSPTRRGMTSDGHKVADVKALGWVDGDAYSVRARRAVRVAVIAPLARVGIEIDAGEIEALLA